MRRFVVALFAALVLAGSVLPGAHAQTTDPGDASTGTDDGAVAAEGEAPAPAGDPDSPAAGDDAAADPDGVTAPEAESQERDILDDGDRSVQIVEYDPAGYPWVDVVVSVPPALAGELQPGSFSLTENGGVRSLDVVKLRDVIEVVLVVDTSGSMAGQPMESAKAAALDFVASLDSDTRIAVVGFGATATTRAPLGSTREVVNAAIQRLEADGETALYDALALASEQFGTGKARRFVVVLSDGKDTTSQATVDDAGQALADAEANLYAITLRSDDADFSGLETLADQVDGHIVAATDAASLSDTYAAVASRLTNQYRLTYRSSARGAAAVVIAVDANGILAVASEELEVAPAAEVPGVDPETGGAGPSEVVIDTSNPEITKAPSTGGLLGSANALYIGAGGIFLGVAAAVFMAMSSDPKGPSAFERLNFAPGRSKRTGLSQIADRATGIADRFLESQERRGALDSALERAGLEMRPGEYVMAVVGLSLLVGVAGAVLMAPLNGLIFFAVALVCGRFYVNMKASKRQKRFGAQLGDTLMMIAGSLRAGHGVAEAIDTVASQADSPTGEEFSRAVAESRIGRDMVESLYDIADRTASEDFIWVVRAIGINRELGGDLAEILDNVGETIRDRNRLRDQVKALSAEGKVSAMILFALPICVGAWVKMTNPEYLASMTQETSGKVMLGMAVVALVLGGIWLRKLVKVDF